MAEENKNQNQNLTTGEEKGDEFWTKLKEKLMKDLDIVSSEPTELEKTIQTRIKGLEEAKEKRAKGIEARFERLATEVREEGERRLTAAREARRGFATNIAFFRQIEEATEKSLRDLELRKQEALAAGEVEIAQQISNLQIQELAFKYRAKQDLFENALAAINLDVAQEREERIRRQQEVENQREKLNFLIENNLIQDLPKEELNRMEKELGLPSNVLEKIKTKEKTELNLQRIGDSLVNITTDETGKPKVEVLYTAPRQVEPLAVEREWIAAGGEKGTGMTLSQYILTRRGIEQPKEFSDEELEAMARKFKAGGGTEKTPPLTYQQALDAITLDPNILNKERAKFIISKEYGQIPEGTTFEQWLKIRKGEISIPKEEPSKKSPLEKVGETFREYEESLAEENPFLQIVNKLWR
ncbi:MAG: hypothetical protein DRP08_03355 [Candidatus Aenigmatarchaeota archaeon]|nr:MAG: hypothetical protein DRP08_03355 [Candidatus Aenigmarchaeota archaeon]